MDSNPYFAEGLPYVAVMTIAVIMYKRLGLSNTEIALYTSLALSSLDYQAVMESIRRSGKNETFSDYRHARVHRRRICRHRLFYSNDTLRTIPLAFFWLLAFSSATHDIAADGFYMLGLNNKEQSFFVGIRNTFYRLANIFGQGILVMLAGWLETSQGNIPLAWSITFTYWPDYSRLLLCTIALSSPIPIPMSNVPDSQQVSY